MGQFCNEHWSYFNQVQEIIPNSSVRGSHAAAPPVSSLWKMRPRMVLPQWRLLAMLTLLHLQWGEPAKWKKVQGLVNLFYNSLWDKWKTREYNRENSWKNSIWYHKEQWVTRCSVLQCDQVGERRLSRWRVGKGRQSRWRTTMGDNITKSHEWNTKLDEFLRHVLRGDNDLMSFLYVQGFYSTIAQDKNGSMADWSQIRNKATDASS